MDRFFFLSLAVVTLSAVPRSAIAAKDPADSGKAKDVGCAELMLLPIEVVAVPAEKNERQWTRSVPIGGTRLAIGMAVGDEQENLVGHRLNVFDFETAKSELSTELPGIGGDFGLLSEFRAQVNLLVASPKGRFIAATSDNGPLTVYKTDPVARHAFTKQSRTRGSDQYVEPLLTLLRNADKSNKAAVAELKALDPNLDWLKFWKTEGEAKVRARLRAQYAERESLRDGEDEESPWTPISLQFHPDETSVFISDGLRATSFDLETGAIMSSFIMRTVSEPWSHRDRKKVLAYLLGGGSLAVSFDYSNIELWNVLGGNRLNAVSRRSKYWPSPRTIIPSPMADFVAAAFEEGDANGYILWTAKKTDAGFELVEARRFVAPVDTQDKWAAPKIAFSLGVNYIVGMPNGEIEVFRQSDHSHKLRFSVESKLNALAISHDGLTAAAAGTKDSFGFVELRRTDSELSVRVPLPPSVPREQAIFSLRFSPDGGRLFVETQKGESDEERSVLAIDVFKVLANAKRASSPPPATKF